MDNLGCRRGRGSNRHYINRRNLIGDYFIATDSYDSLHIASIPKCSCNAKHPISHSPFEQSVHMYTFLSFQYPICQDQISKLLIRARI
jgi:hypothetical protein